MATELGVDIFLRQPGPFPQYATEKRQRATWYNPELNHPQDARLVHGFHLIGTRPDVGREPSVIEA